MTNDQIALQNRAAALVRNEVHLNVSSIVSALAGGYGTVRTDRVLSELIEQAQELAAPTPDYESAAREAGWKATSGAAKINGTLYRYEEGNPYYAADWCDACEASGLEPHDREVYEHWAVSDWFADKLEAKGEKVDRDFAGLTVWARTTTGQAISIDHVVKQIVRDLDKAA